MSPVPIILAALASSNRSVGGGFSAANNNTCPPIGSSAAVAKNANAVFYPGIYSGWDFPVGGRPPDSFDGIENSFVGPDGIAYVATISGDGENPFDAVLGYSFPTDDLVAQCGLTVVGGNIEVTLTDLTGVSNDPENDGLVALFILLDDGETSEYLTSSIGLGAQTLTGELTASQAAQVATGQSPGVVLWFFRGFSDNVASIDSVVATYDWVN